MNRREFLVSASAAGVVAAAENNATSKRKTNVLFILADQWRFSAFGHAGDPNVRTPHFDRLRQEGIDFQQTYAANPLCTPNRSCILTSRYSHQTGMTVLDIQLPPDEPTMTQVFADSGYSTHYVGKWHMDGPAKPGFVPPGWRRRGIGTFEGFNRGHYYPTGAMYFTNEGKLVHPDVYEPTYQTDLAMSFIKKNANRPFFCYLSWGPPHTPYNPPPNWKIYDADKIQWRPNVPDELRRDTWVRNALAGYYGLCSSLDDELGRLLKFLKEQNLEEDTLLVFTSDHGDMLASHGAYYKSKPEEESLHVPLLMRLPQKIKPGAATDTLTSSIDLMPTILSICGLATPKGAMGRNLAPVALGLKSKKLESIYAAGQMRQVTATGAVALKANDDGADPSRRGSPGISQGMEWRALVTEEHKLVTLCDGRTAGLFHRRSDPYELKNLTDDKNAKSLLRHLQAQMKIKGASVDDRFPEIAATSKPSYDS